MDKEKIPGINTKVKITVHPRFDKPYFFNGRIISDVYQDGYTCDSGICYPDKTDDNEELKDILFPNERPCYKVDIMPLRNKTTYSTLKIEEIMSIEVL